MYYPINTVNHLGFVLESKRGNGHCKFSFNEAEIFELILKIFKSTLTNLTCISTLSVNAIFCNLSLILWNFLNLGLVFNFCDMKKDLRTFSGKS